MKSIVRANEEAVSPVIATILMVAITVVLAAVLYVMVSGLIAPTGPGPKQIGATVSRSTDGTNWVILFTSVPTGLGNTSVFISVTTSSGASLVSAIALGSTSSLTAKGIQYNPATAGSATLGANDRILMAIGTTNTGTAYASGDQVTLTASGSILFGPQTLQ